MAGLFTMPFRNVPSSGRCQRCVVFRIAPWQTRIMDGSTVTQQMTPNTTPFAMTRPMSRPKVKLMKQRAIKPATVVRLLPRTEENVAAIA